MSTSTRKLSPFPPFPSPPYSSPPSSHLCFLLPLAFHLPLPSLFLPSLLLPFPLFFSSSSSPVCFSLNLPHFWSPLSFCSPKSSFHAVWDLLNPCSERSNGSAPNGLVNLWGKESDWSLSLIMNENGEEERGGLMLSGSESTEWDNFRHLLLWSPTPTELRHIPRKCDEKVCLAALQLFLRQPPCLLVSCHRDLLAPEPQSLTPVTTYCTLCSWLWTFPLIWFHLPPQLLESLRNVLPMKGTQ